MATHKRTPFSVELADELIELVLRGQKRATAGSLAEYESEGAALPKVGDRWIACDGQGRPRAVIETTEVRVGPLSSVDEQFAWDEGEGDRTRADWLRSHTAYFTRTRSVGDPFPPRDPGSVRALRHGAPGAGLRARVNPPHPRSALAAGCGVEDPGELGGLGDHWPVP